MVSLKELYSLPPEVRQIMSRATNSSFKIDSVHKKGIFVFDTSKIMIWSLDNAEKSATTFLSITSRSSFSSERPFKADNVFIFATEPNFLSVLAVHPLGTIAYWKNVIANVISTPETAYTTTTDEIYVIPPTRSIEYTLVNDYFASTVVPCFAPSTDDDDNNNDDDENDSNFGNEFLVGSERGAIYKIIVKPFLTIIEIYKSNIFRDEITLKKTQAADSEKTAVSSSSSSGFFGFFKYGWWQQQQQQSAKDDAQKVPQDDKFCCFVDGQNDLTFLTERWLVVYSDGAFKDFRDVNDYASPKVYCGQKFLGATRLSGSWRNGFTAFVMATRKENNINVILTVEIDDDLVAKVTGEVILNGEFENGIRGVVRVDESHFVCLAGNSLFTICGDKMRKLRGKLPFVSLSNDFVVINDTIFSFDSNDDEKEEEDEEECECECEEEDNDEEMCMNDEEEKMVEKEGEEEEEEEEDVTMKDAEDEHEKDAGVVDNLFAAVINENQKEFARVIRGYPSHNYSGILTATSKRVANCGVDDLPSWFKGPDADSQNDFSFASKVIEKKNLIHKKFASWVGKEYCNNTSVIGYNLRLLDVANKFQTRVEKM